MATRNSSAGKNGALDPALPQKKRARRRLVGAAAVCLLAAILLPIILDSEPRHAREDVQVRIPSRDTPLRDAEDGAVQGVIGGAARAGQGATARGQDEDAAGEPMPDPEAEAGVDAAAGASPAAGAASAGAASSGAASAGATSSAAAGATGASRTGASPAPSKAPAKTPPAGLDAGATKSAVAAAAAGAPPSLSVPAQEPKLEARPELRPADNRTGFVLQAGAFASEKSAAEQQARVSKAGLKAYTEKISTSQGPRIRVRVGPFASRDAADKARTALKAAGVESALIAP
ncbi:hypothetical protein GCM10023089_29260 [Quisquiliibacterium transsilvanicum]